MRLLGRLIALVLNLLEKSSLTIGILFFASITVIAVIGVIMRYTVHQPIQWETQILTMLMAWGVFLGLASVTRNNSHIRISFFADKLLGRRRAAWAGSFIESFVGFCACSFLAYLSGRWILLSATHNALLWQPRLGIAIGMALMAVFYAERLIRHLRRRDDFMNGDDEEYRIGDDF